MALYVIRPDDPPPGQDWQASVPGQYLYNVTGVYATLTTASGPDAPTDYSGNGHDGTYQTSGGPVQFSSAGAFDGDDCLVSGNGPIVTATAGWTMPLAAMPIDTVGSFTLGFWRNNAEAFGPGIVWSNSLEQCAQAFNGNSTVLEWDAVGFAGGLWTTPNIYPFDNLWHFIVYAYDAGAQEMKIYFDGVNVPLDNDSPGLAYSDIPTRVDWDPGLGSGYGSRGLTDEVLFVPITLSAGAVAALYATAPDFTAWTNAILALSPITAYHLDGSGPSTGGRQVTLSITDSNNEVERIPSGFDPLLTPGPYAWSWLPKLNSAAENATSKTITVPLPRLLLPAGYTIGTKTLDIAPSDQWSDISIWWNSDVMDASQELNPYDYPPGALLVYRQVQGST